MSDVEFFELQRRVNAIEKKLDSIFAIVKGIAIGLAIGAVIFGFITVKDLVSVAK